MRLYLVLLVSTFAVDARVTFDKSEVLDNVDLKGTNTASFRCSGACRVFSPTPSDTIQVIDDAGINMMSLRMLSELNSNERFQYYELPGGNYKLKNYGKPDPSFVFYAIEEGAANYETEVIYVSKCTTVGRQNTKNCTFLSSSGSVNFWDFAAFSSADPLPSVYAAGADSVAACRPVFKTRSAVTLSNTVFAVNSPIATVTFDRVGTGKWFIVSGDSMALKMEEFTSVVYASPGYVGCPSVGDSLYTLLPPVTRIDASATLSRSSGLTVSVNGDYSIANQADALALTVNDDSMKLFGKSSISKTYDDSKFNINLSWKKKEGCKDAFAIQIDIDSTAHPNNLVH